MNRAVPDMNPRFIAANGASLCRALRCKLGRALQEIAVIHWRGERLNTDSRYEPAIIRFQRIKNGDKKAGLWDTVS